MWRRLDLPKPMGPRNTVASPRKVSLAGLQDNGFVEGMMLKMMIAFADVNAQRQHGVREICIIKSLLVELMVSSGNNVAEPDGNQT